MKLVSGTTPDQLLLQRNLANAPLQDNIRRASLQKQQINNELGN